MTTNQNKILKINHCIDCNKEIGGRSTRCVDCNKKYLWSDPIFRQHISETMLKTNIRLWNDPNHIAAMKERDVRRCNNLVYKRSVSEQLKKQWENNIIFRNSVTASAKIHTTARWADSTSNLRIYMDTYHFIPSSLECKFKDLLDNAGILYIQQYKPDKCTKVYDFFLPLYNTLVEIDGTFWHHSEWAIQHGSRVNDDIKDKWAVDNGYDMVRIPENDMPADIVTNWLLPELLKVGALC